MEKLTQWETHLLEEQLVIPVPIDILAQPFDCFAVVAEKYMSAARVLGIQKVTFQVGYYSITVQNPIEYVNSAPEDLAPST